LYETIKKFGYEDAPIQYDEIDAKIDEIALMFHTKDELNSIALNAFSHRPLSDIENDTQKLVDD
jgi:hypothetical protein